MIQFSYIPLGSGLTLPVITGIVLIATWVILAGSRFIQGGVVERPERVPQLYGYTVCLIALIWAVTSVIAIVENSLAMSAPEQRRRSEPGWELSVSSFEAFRITYRARPIVGPDGAVKYDSIPETELRRRYDGLRADRIIRGRFEAQRNLITAGLSLVIAVALFVFHWRWLRRHAVVAGT